MEISRSGGRRRGGFASKINRSRGGRCENLEEKRVCRQRPVLLLEEPQQPFSDSSRLPALILRGGGARLVCAPQLGLEPAKNRALQKYLFTVANSLPPPALHAKRFFQAVQPHASGVLMPWNHLASVLALRKECPGGQLCSIWDTWAHLAARHGHRGTQLPQGPGLQGLLGRSRKVLVAANHAHLVPRQHGNPRLDFAGSKRPRIHCLCHSPPNYLAYLRSLS